MNIYLVRRAETKAILGVYWSESLYNLWWTIDELGEPSIYEAAELCEPGAIHFPGQEPVAVQSNLCGDDEENADFTFAGAEPSQNLLASIHQQSALEWAALPDAREIEAYRRKAND